MITQSRRPVRASEHESCVCVHDISPRVSTTDHASHESQDGAACVKIETRRRTVLLLLLLLYAHCFTSKRVQSNNTFASTLLAQREACDDSS